MGLVRIITGTETIYNRTGNNKFLVKHVTDKKKDENTAPDTNDSSPIDLDKPLEGIIDDILESDNPKFIGDGKGALLDIVGDAINNDTTTTTDSEDSLEDVIEKEWRKP